MATMKKLWLFPVACFCFFMASMFITYAVAVAEGHVDSFWPYISTAGTTPPESCVFGQLLNIAALLIAICVYLRHREIATFYKGTRGNDQYWRIASIIFMCVGFLSALGTSIVANFQETSVLTVHLIGAFMAFGFGILYGWAQTIYTYMMTPRMGSLAINHIRLLLCILATMFFCIMEATGYSTNSRHKPPTPAPGQTDSPIINHWSSSDPGYAKHIISTFCEWLMVISFQIYILTFAYELRYAQLSTPKMLLRMPDMPQRTVASAPPAESGLQQVQYISRPDNEQA